jgi:hypothetical protein
MIRAFPLYLIFPIFLVEFKNTDHQHSSSQYFQHNRCYIQRYQKICMNGAVHLPKERRVTIIMMNWDLEVIY